MVCVCRTVALRATAARVRAHTTCIHIRGAYAQALMGASFSARTQPASGCRRGAVSIACASWLPEVVEAASDSTDMASSLHCASLAFRRSFRYSARSTTRRAPPKYNDTKVVELKDDE